MGTFRSLRRKLNAEKVWVAQKVAEKRNEIVKAFVEERVKEDAEFAQDVLNAVGENLPENIKKAAEETIKNGPKTPKVEKQEIVDSVAENLSPTPTLKGKLQYTNSKTNPGRIYPYPLKNP